MVHSYESAHVAALEGISSVLNYGPLWSSSLFVFKDWNGNSSNYFHGTQNIAGQIMTAVTSQQQLPEVMKEMPPGSAKDLVMRLRGQHKRSNKPHQKGDCYAVGALKSGSCTTEPFEDNLQASLGLDVSSVKFFRNSTKGFPEETHSQLHTDWMNVPLLNMAR
ncbi:hypothetical protein AWC38_SpisGene14763 [Stylophora pistillata]|uniref:Uncharacterized protein n=1 Tax=Stylophora pistillata TaxID=50429 RepID=A0A2B4RW28_STYPI|nr:hypothetical protein AWC38_SpisGene14763 [Stylophora pistillata]